MIDADVVIVGGGPRAVSVVERLTARHGSGPPLAVAVIDSVEVGAGATWRTDQRPEFLNNTYAAHTTIYPDGSTPMAGPISPGPDLATWAKRLAAGRSPVPTGAPARPVWVAAEAAALEPWSFPSRRLQGVYYREQLATVLTRGGVQLRPIRGVAVAVDTPPARGGVIVRLADGRSVQARRAVLAQGMVQAAPSARTRSFQRAAAAHRLCYIEPGMPSERDWDRVPAGQDVLVAGLGANFFDVIAALTTARGGRLVPETGPHSGAFDLRYEPSGREPHLIAGSPRGLPYRSKSFYGKLPVAYVPQLATDEWFAERVGRTGLDFQQDIWPQLQREVVVAQLATVAVHRPESAPQVRLADPGDAGSSAHRAVGAQSASVLGLNRLHPDLLREIAHTPPPKLGELVARYVIPPSLRQDPARLDRPSFARQHGTARLDWRRYLHEWAWLELESITSPETSARASVNRAVAYLRNQVAALVAADSISATSSLRDVNGWFLRLNIALASGPPPERTALLLALIKAGVVELIGEHSQFSVSDDGHFVGESAVTGQRFETRALIETRMSKGQVDVTDDPLLQELLGTGRARLWRVPSDHGSSMTAPTLDVDRDTFALVNLAGRPNPNIVVLGIPAGDIQPGSAIGATPGVPSPLIGGADRVAAQLLAEVTGAGEERHPLWDVASV